MTEAEKGIMIREICKKIEAIVSDLADLVEILNRSPSSIDREMGRLVFSKLKTTTICDNILLIYKDMVAMKYLYNNKEMIVPNNKIRFNADDKFEQLLKDSFNNNI